MGASASIFFSTIGKSYINCMVLDSPYDKLTNFIKRIAEMKVSSMPSFVVSAAISMIESQIKERTGIMISKINPCEYAPQIGIPSMWIIGDQDEYQPT